jgi:hypothetical protein
MKQRRVRKIIEDSDDEASGRDSQDEDDSSGDDNNMAPTEKASRMSRLATHPRRRTGTGLRGRLSPQVFEVLQILKSPIGMGILGPRSKLRHTILR